jgi:hypothetical protein
MMSDVICEQVLRFPQNDVVAKNRFLGATTTTTTATTTTTTATT